MSKKIEDLPEIIQPVQPTLPIDNAKMVGILRDKLNETITMANVLRDEIIKMKAKHP